MKKLLTAICILSIPASCLTPWFLVVTMLTIWPALSWLADLVFDKPGGDKL